jgi:arabinogalactan endo-1,4-beta-galactosidase
MKNTISFYITNNYRSRPVTIIIPVIILILIMKTSILSGQEYAIGADLSFLKNAEDRGFKFKENDIAKPGLMIFKDHGYNWIRLRLFHTPTDLPNNLDYTISLAKKAKDNGFKFLLDYHYSDTWADPGKQFTPVAWTGMSHN